MPEYLLHPNGHGKLLDDSEANRSTYLSQCSSASGFAKLRDATLLERSVARGKCQIYGGLFLSTCIEGDTIVAGKPRVYSSLLACSEVSGSALIEHSFLAGNTEVCDSPVIKRSTLSDAIVYGSPRILDCMVTGRIHEGTWVRAPKHIKLPWCDLSECIDGKMLLNCYCRPVEWWLRFGPRVAKKWDWNQDQIDITLDTIRKQFYSGEHGRRITVPVDASQSEAQRHVNL